MATAAIYNLAPDPELSVLLALQAVNATYAVDQAVLPEAEVALHRAVSASHSLFTLDPEEHGRGWVPDVVFGPDDTHLAISGSDGVARIRDTPTGQEPLALSGHTGFVLSVDFGPDGTHLATSGSGGWPRCGT